MVTIDCTIGKNVKIRDNADLYQCIVGDNTRIGSFVVAEEKVKIGKNCKIKCHVFMPTGLEIADGVFVGPGVCFTNDMYPRAVDETGRILGEKEFYMKRTYVGEGAVIGARAVIGPGLTIGKYSVVGMGSVVLNDVKEYTVVAGNPARYIYDRIEYENRIRKAGM